MSFTTYLLLFAAASVVSYASWVWYWARKERDLKRSPPKQVCFEVMLARGIDDSSETMTRLYRKVAKNLRPHLPQFINGSRRMSVVLHISVPQQTPVLRVYIFTDEEQVDELKRRIRGDFRGSVFITQLDEDPMASLADAVKPEKYQVAPAG